MSFLKKLFGGGSSEATETGSTKPAKQVEHKGFLISATPYKAEGQYQTCGVVSKEVDGVMKEHRFIRADRFAGLDDAVDISIKKGIQLVDEQGERMFG
ncbi:HlyU family transcriptional regulator [Mesorhizobium sp. RIZ17]|uniref:HlyU family transcriptional regulator n=1 Tax=Mesorhizobium sp. RIZ17 TaxID=3132743 RepID=UPI003DA9BF81